jgi:hypothetical protein
LQNISLELAIVSWISLPFCRCFSCRLTAFLNFRFPIRFTWKVMIGCRDSHFYMYFFFSILTDLFCPPCLFPGSSELKRGRKKADFNQLL